MNGNGTWQSPVFENWVGHDFEVRVRPFTHLLRKVGKWVNVYDFDTFNPSFGSYPTVFEGKYLDPWTF